MNAPRLGTCQVDSESRPVNPYPIRLTHLHARSVLPVRHLLHAGRWWFQCLFTSAGVPFAQLVSARNPPPPTHLRPPPHHHHHLSPSIFKNILPVDTGPLCRRIGKGSRNILHCSTNQSQSRIGKMTVCSPHSHNSAAFGCCMDFFSQCFAMKDEHI